MSSFKSLSPRRFIPGKDVLFGNQRFGFAIAIQVKHTGIGITKINIRKAIKCPEWLPFVLIT